MITHFLIFLAQIVFKLFWDKRAKDSGRIINHTQSAIIDGLIYVASIYFLTDLGIVDMILMFALTCVLRWTIFDIGFNLINGDKWNHAGNSAKLDLFLDKIDGEKDNISKYGIVIKAVLICILSVIIGYKYV